jgi:hypothetical protein
LASAYVLWPSANCSGSPQFQRTEVSGRPQIFRVPNIECTER